MKKRTPKIEKTIRNKFQCPQCGSENVQRVSLLVAAGTQNVAAISLGGSAGHAGLNAGAGLSSGSLTSELVQSLRPPVKPTSKEDIARCRNWVLIFIAMFALISLLYPDGSGVATFFIGLFIAVYLYSFIKIAKSKEQHMEYTEKLQEWEKLFICLRCGTTFEL